MEREKRLKFASLIFAAAVVCEIGFFLAERLVVEEFSIVKEVVRNIEEQGPLIPYALWILVKWMSLFSMVVYTIGLILYVFKGCGIKIFRIIALVNIVFMGGIIALQVGAQIWNWSRMESTLAWLMGTGSYVAVFAIFIYRLLYQRRVLQYSIHQEITPVFRGVNVILVMIYMLIGVACCFARDPWRGCVFFVKAIGLTALIL